MSRRTRVKHPVVLIHGIRTDGAWQDELAPLLAQFFEPVKVRYSQYRGNFGALCVFYEPWVVLLACVCALASYSIGWIPAWHAATAGLAACLLSALPGAVELRRLSALREYKLATTDTFHKTPHLIAHSFGTYLTARLLAQLPAAAFRRVILCGCVLPGSFDWYAQIQARRVDQVRNDYTRADPIGGLARLAGFLHPNLGNSGSMGMDRGLAQVHRLPKPDLACDACVNNATAAPIHDVDCSAMGHSDALLVRAHCRRWWLPFLWGFDPGEHWELLEFCRRWTEAAESYDWATTGELEVVLRSKSWGWCNGQTIWTHLERAMYEEGRAISAAKVVFAFNRFAYRFEAARSCDHDEPEVIFLQPNYAVSQILPPRHAV